MRATIPLCLMIALFVASSIAIATIPTAVKMTKVGLTESQIKYGPGSEVPLRTPIERNYVWIVSVEPIKVRWTYYDPLMHRVYTEEHPPTLKNKITSGEHAGKWAVADMTAFTIPAFATKGNWYAKPEIILANGQIMEGVSAENPEAIYITFPVTESGTIWDNLFNAPWYAFGIKFPAIFWFPLSLFWIPGVFVVICAIFTHSITGFVDVIKGAIRAGREARRRWVAR